MSTPFKYQARTPEGRTVTGTLTANSADEAISQLRAQNLTVLKVDAGAQKKGGGFSLLTGGVKAPRARVKSDELVVFTRQLATMISAGIPLMEALEILTEQTMNPGFKVVLQKTVESVRGGTDLSEAMGQFPRVFARIYVNMIKAGEASGQLDAILDRLAEYQEATAKLKREIRSAMTYPIVSLCLILGITILLLVFIIPKFQPIFDALGGKEQLPLPTKVLLGVSVFMQNNILYLFGGVVLLVMAVVSYVRTENGRYQWHWLLLQLPVFGQLFKKVAISRFSRTFATLIESGVPILGALEIVSQTTGNRIVERAVEQARESVRQGENLAKPLTESKVFPPMVTRMISIGEKSGALESLLKKIAEFYDQQVQAAVDGLTALIEPLLIGVMGVLVGGIVLAVFMPIFKLQAALSAPGASNR